jgi:hypothetical protein
MDEISLTIIVKGVGMVLLIFGGFAQIFVGFKLYKDGTGSIPEKSSMQFGKFRLNTNSVGSLIMGTAAIWAGFAVQMNPSIKLDHDKKEVFSFLDSPDALQLPVLKASPSNAPSEQGDLKPDQLKGYFSAAVEAASSVKGGGNNLTINGKPAYFDLNNLTALTSDRGEYYVSSEIRSESAAARITYVPKFHDGKLLFMPSEMNGQIIRHTTKKPYPAKNGMPLEQMEINNGRGEKFSPGK